jgi:metal-sulfur cluster biosynthetic enzyme
MGEILVDDVRSKLEMIPTVAEADVDLVFDPPWGRHMMSEAARLETGMLNRPFRRPGLRTALSFDNLQGDPMNAPAPLTYRVTRSDHAKSAPSARHSGQPRFWRAFHRPHGRHRWDKASGWHDARVQPYGPLSLDPAAAVLHYGQEIFEGIKAYRHADGSIWTFRPQANGRACSVRRSAWRCRNCRWRSSSNRCAADRGRQRTGCRRRRRPACTSARS